MCILRHSNVDFFSLVHDSWVLRAWLKFDAWVGCKVKCKGKTWVWIATFKGPQFTTREKNKNVSLVFQKIVPFARCLVDWIVHWRLKEMNPSIGLWLVLTTRRCDPTPTLCTTWKHNLTQLWMNHNRLLRFHLGQLSCKPFNFHLTLP
jgi:hypothetical protein